MFVNHGNKPKIIDALRISMFKVTHMLIVLFNNSVLLGPAVFLTLVDEDFSVHHFHI